MKSKRRYNEEKKHVYYTIRYSKVLHRDDGPAVIFDYEEGEDRIELWYRYNLLHRIDGPAYNDFDGEKRWYFKGKLHRLDGPAIEHPYGNYVWYIDGKRHRLDGPAAIYSNGDLEWWINGVKYDKEKFFESLTSEQKQKILFSEYFIK